MRLPRSLLALPIACAVLGAGLYSLPASNKAQELIGRSVTLGGHELQCNNAQIMVDRTLPSEGAADDDNLILNPDMLKDQPETVRIFIFKHECGHLTVGDSELAADCFAVHQGVHEQWLDRKGLDQVCQSFGGDPETDTHPSGERRCRNLDKCYAEALAEQRGSAPATAAVVQTPGKSSLLKKTLANKPPAAKALAANPAPAQSTPAKRPVIERAQSIAKPAVTSSTPNQKTALAVPAVEAPVVASTGTTPNAALPTAEAQGGPVNEETTAAAAHTAVSSWRCTVAGCR